jgi:hypothetical protein
MGLGDPFLAAAPLPVSFLRSPWRARVDRLSETTAAPIALIPSG